MTIYLSQTGSIILTISCNRITVPLINSYMTIMTVLWLIGSKAKFLLRALLLNLSHGLTRSIFQSACVISESPCLSAGWLYTNTTCSEILVHLHTAFYLHWKSFVFLTTLLCLTGIKVKCWIDLSVYKTITMGSKFKYGYSCYVPRFVFKKSGVFLRVTNSMLTKELCAWLVCTWNLCSFHY